MQLRRVASKICIVFIMSAIGHASRCAAEKNNAKVGGLSRQAVFKVSLVSALFDEEIVADNVFAVRHREFRLPESDRYNYLAKWVLPSESQTLIRMSGERVSRLSWFRRYAGIAGV
jgi:hypothetical protein